MASELNGKVVSAAKWSALAEGISKLVGPITSMVLARVLTPEAFGVVTTLTMIIAFVEIFTDAGFQRYIIQHEFKDSVEQDESTNVAFWSNIAMSFLFWGGIALFADSLAVLVGNPGLGNVLIVAGISIPIQAFSSIQMAVFRRLLDFKSLFFRRLVSTLIPLFVTVPLALWLRSYWALVFGTIAVNLSNAIVLTLQSPWKPRFYFNFRQLKDMMSFSVWSLLDAILIWATNYVEIFFISSMLSAYYLGIYKTSMTTVSQFTSIITATVLPLIMPTLSRIQNDYSAMRQMLLAMQKYLGMMLLPIGFGIFMFSQLITDILLGSQWQEAVPYIGIWGLMEVVTVVFSRMCSNIFPAIGRPKISVIVQILHLVVLVPAVYISIGYGFHALFYTRAFVRFELVIIYMLFAYYVIRLSPWSMLKNLFPEFVACFVMSITAYFLLSLSSNSIVSICWCAVCACVYLGVLYLMPNERKLMLELKKKLINR